MSRLQFLIRGVNLALCPAIMMIIRETSSEKPGAILFDYGRPLVSNSVCFFLLEIQPRTHRQRSRSKLLKSALKCFLASKVDKELVRTVGLLLLLFFSIHGPATSIFRLEGGAGQVSRRLAGREEGSARRGSVFLSLVEFV